MTCALVVGTPEVDAAGLVDLAHGAADEVRMIMLVGEGDTAAPEPGADSTIALALPDTDGEGLASGLAGVMSTQQADVIVLPATNRFREAAALLTGQLDASCAPDAVSVARTADGLVADRLLYGGVVVASVLLQRPRAVLTGRVGVREKVTGLLAAETLAAPRSDRKELLSVVAVPRSGDLSTAGRIVAFGRGLRAKDDMALIETLAAALGAEIGCSRPIVEDVRWLEVAHQVGLTGTTVQPDLYLAIGISGQIQHLVGMRDSRYIVAINNNPSAPIFDACDLAVVGDLYEIVPRLASALAARSA